MYKYECLEVLQIIQALNQAVLLHNRHNNLGFETVFKTDMYLTIYIHEHFLGTL